MSKNSSRQQYLTNQEWLRWAKKRYPSLRKKKKPSTPPAYMGREDDYK
jgi:hypothetical protein